MGGDKIERLRAGELLRHLVYRSAISSTETGLDHERGTIADNEADVGTKGTLLSGMIWMWGRPA